MRLLSMVTLSIFALASAAAPSRDRVPTAPPAGLQQYLRDTMQQHNIPGMQVAVVRKGEIVLLSAFGLADIENQLPVTDATVFPIASATKAFTGVALMQLVERGELDLTAPISQYLDSLPATWRQVTVRELATHISGLPNLVDNDTGQPITGVPIACADEPAWHAVWDKVQTLPMEFSPGEQTRYNQTNYALLGRLIDEISGVPFTLFIKERQLDVVGMSGTRYGDDSEVVPHRARAYSMLDARGGQATKLTERYVRFAPFLLTAAGLNSTARDLAHWIIALQQGRLLKKSSLEALWTPSILRDGKPGTWGLGWPIVAREKHTSYMPYGGAKAAIAVYPEDDVAVVILTNLQGSMPERFIDRVAAYYIADFRPD